MFEFIRRYRLDFTMLNHVSLLADSDALEEMQSTNRQLTALLVSLRKHHLSVEFCSVQVQTVHQDEDASDKKIRQVIWRCSLT